MTNIVVLKAEAMRE